MVRVGVWNGLEGGVERRLLPRIVRRELAARLPEIELRTWSTTEGDADATPLGPWSPSRVDELAAAVDLVVIAGRLMPERRFLVDGVGPVHEVDVPTVWHGIRLGDEPDGPFAERVRAALERRECVTAGDASTAERLAALAGRDVDVVPADAVLADRLFRPDEPEERVTKLRAAGLLPDGDLLVVQVGDASGPHVAAIGSQVQALCRTRALTPVLVPASAEDEPVLEALAAAVPDARTLPDDVTLDDLCAVVAWSAGVVAEAPDLAQVAAAFGRPAVIVDAGVDAAVIERLFDLDPASGADGTRDERARLDAHFDAVAALVADAPRTDLEERRIRSLTARLTEREAAAAAREHELEDMIEKLSRQITEGDIRFVGLWKKIRECDKHYAWQFDRAEAAEALVAQLEVEVEWLRANQRQPSWWLRGYLWIRRRVALTLRRLGLRRSEPEATEPDPTEPPNA